MTAEALKANLDFNSDAHEFKIPQKKIGDMKDLERFLQSAAAKDLTMFIIETQAAVKGTQMTKTAITDNLKPLEQWLEKLDKLLDENPPIE